MEEVVQSILAGRCYSVLTKRKAKKIQFKPSVHAKGKQLAQELNISFQELLERLILNAIGETK